MINDFFNWCVLVLEIMAEYTGMSYELINILIFVILQPLLILFFFSFFFEFQDSVFINILVSFSPP